MSDSILSLFLSEGRRVIGLFLSAGRKLSEKKSNHSERLRSLDDESQRTVHKLAYSLGPFVARLSPSLRIVFG